MSEPAESPAVHLEQIARETGLNSRSVAATAKLLAGGATVPFIARYRKEATGSLDEVQVAAIRDRMVQLAELDQRRSAIIKSLDERNLLTAELRAKLAAAATVSVLEDIFAPFRPKRQTRATIARDRGLAPLAEWLLANQDDAAADPLAAAAGFLTAEVADAEAAMAGARDIVAEQVAEDAELRGRVRRLYAEEAQISSKVMFGKEESQEAARFRDYFDWSEPLKAIPSHRLLAIRRGEKEGILFMRIHVPLERVTALAVPAWVTGRGPTAAQLELAVEDGCKRLLMPSMETEMRLASKKAADETAIRVFAENLRELLLASPLGQKRVLTLDPGFRTGCKTVVLDRQGQLLEHTVVFVVGSPQQLLESARTLLGLVKKHAIEVIAIGNGTASREAEAFVGKLGLPASIPVVMVNESGASIYSASEVAREEFPDHDVTVRGAVSIGRRLLDPLAELVKLDPKSIGVGQYQHDVDQRLLKAGLDDVVVSCVNAVGVEVNTASKELLSYVSGFNRTLAENLVAWRNQHGPFQSRSQLRDVPRLGEKAFEQAAGFLRVRGGKHPLDASAVHPERYPLVEKMAADLGCKVDDLLASAELRGKIQLERYVDAEVGLPTLRDILEELAKPGRDPRKSFEIFQFAEGVNKPADLAVGMRLPGRVTNVTAFGAFVDVGVHQDGLVHVSQLADHFVKDPAEVVKVGQTVSVTVVELDLARQRIGLSLKSKPDFDGARKPARQGGPASTGEPRRGQQPQRPSRDQPGNDWFSQAMNRAKK